MRPWRGRVRARVRRAFIAFAGQDVPTGTLVRWCWPRRQRFETWMYYRCRTAAYEIGDMVGHQHGGAPRPALAGCWVDWDWAGSRA
jgi:hypothetical protein